MSMWLEVRFLPRTPASLAHLVMSIDVASVLLALLANFLNAASMTAQSRDLFQTCVHKFRNAECEILQLKLHNGYSQSRTLRHRRVKNNDLLDNLHDPVTIYLHQNKNSTYYEKCVTYNRKKMIVAAFHHPCRFSLFSVTLATLRQ